MGNAEFYTLKLEKDNQNYIEIFGMTGSIPQVGWTISMPVDSIKGHVAGIEKEVSSEDWGDKEYIVTKVKSILFKNKYNSLENSFIVTAKMKV